MIADSESDKDEHVITCSLSVCLSVCLSEWQIIKWRDVVVHITLSEGESKIKKKLKGSNGQLNKLTLAPKVGSKLRAKVGAQQQDTRQKLFR